MTNIVDMILLRILVECLCRLLLLLAPMTFSFSLHSAGSHRANLIIITTKLITWYAKLRLVSRFALRRLVLYQ